MSLTLSNVLFSTSNTAIITNFDGGNQTEQENVSTEDKSSSIENRFALDISPAIIPGACPSGQKKDKAGKCRLTT